uniref:Metalloendopeptidase n=1 Tax=Globodera rostochiensis TaxID=31243 RepID=A0A914I0V2_GLORO
MGREGWHALIIGRMSDGKGRVRVEATAGLLENEFQKALHLGAFMDDFNGMAFRVLALDLLSAIGPNGTELCKMKCALEPSLWKEDHFGTSCTEIVFPANIPKFMLNISVSPYRLACNKYQKRYPITETPPPEYYARANRFVDACMQVPTSKCQKHAEVYICYKSINKWTVNSSIAEMCQKHLSVDPNSNFAGFVVEICVHRDAKENMLVVESFVNISFSNEPFKTTQNFSITLDGVRDAMEKLPIFFLEFGMGNRQSIIRFGKKWDNDNAIGAILNDIALEKINGSWAKKLHFVPPLTDRMRVFFQIAKPEFSKLITNRTKVKPYENNPNNTNNPTPCDLYGDDCKPIRELLHKIKKLNGCKTGQGSHGRGNIDFKIPLWAPRPPSKKPFMLRPTETLLCDGDMFCKKEKLQKEYNDKRRSCGLEPESDDHRQKRQYRLDNATIGKWTEFPILIVPTNYDAWETAIKIGANLIMKETCIRFELVEEIAADKEGIGISNLFSVVIKNDNMSVTAAHELLHALGLLHEQSRSDARNFTILKSQDEQSETYDTKNFEFAYDFGSVMHYGADYIPPDNYNIITLPRFYQQTIGQSERISFKDVAIINYIYCQHSCKGHKMRCKNRGYLNPNDCSKCLCPDGYDGQNCESLKPNLNCVDTTGIPRELEADRTNRPKDGQRARIQLKSLNHLLGCTYNCSSSYVEIKYRSDKRAQGAKLCCPSALRDPLPNDYKNWIEAEAPDVEIIVSTHISKNLANPTTWFELNYEAGYFKLTDSCDCVNPENLYIEKRNPHTNLECRADGASKSFWGYRENAKTDPIRVDEVQCLSYKAAGVKPSKFKSLNDKHRQFNQSAQTIKATINIGVGQLYATKDQFVLTKSYA